MKKRILLFVIVYLMSPVVSRSQDKATVYTQGNSGLPNGYVSAIAIDNSGNKWVGTWGGGLAKFDGKTWIVFNSNNSNLPSDFVNAIAIDSQKRVWAGTDKGLVCYEGAKWNEIDGLPDDHIESIAIDDLGIVWVGTRQGGLAEIDGRNLTIHNTDNSKLPSNDVRAILIDPNGNKWIGTDDGLVRFDGKSWVVYNMNNSKLPGDNVSALEIDLIGIKWIGTSGGLAEFDGMNWQTYNEKSGLPNGRVVALSTDEMGNIWVGTAAGLAKFDQTKWTTFNIENSGLAGIDINTIIIDSKGNKWVGSSSGLSESQFGTPAAGLNTGTDWGIAYKSIREGKFQDASHSIRDYFSKRKLDELGYTEEFFKAFDTLLSQGRNDDAFAVLNQLGRLTLQDIMTTYVKLAEIFVEMDDPGTSITILGRVLANDPTNKEASEKLGQAYYSAGRYDEVIRVFGSNKDSEPMRYLGLAYEKKCMFIQANKVWQAIANSQQGDSLANEANEHIRQNTIALMTTNQSQTKTEENASSVQPQQPTAQAVTTAKEQTPVSESACVAEVDSDIPRGVEQHSSAVALILAIPQYQSSSIPEVKYAKNDAGVLRQYLIKSLGFKPENILPMIPDEQLTYGRIQSYIKSILPSYLKPDGSSDLFIYYAGHGAPNTTNHEAYLVPWDCDPNYVNDNNAYDMKRFYMDIAGLKARRKVVVVDACFPAIPVMVGSYWPTQARYI